MKSILLTQGKTTFVDDQDYDWLKTYSWHVVHVNKLMWYAARTVRNGKDIKTVYMHREIGAVAGIPNVDHCDGDGLNNQRTNLRAATRKQNAQNRRKFMRCSSIFKGVTWRAKISKWESYIRIDGQGMYLGSFAREEQAAAAYDEAAKFHFGVFARTNNVFNLNERHQANLG